MEPVDWAAAPAETLLMHLTLAFLGMEWWQVVVALVGVLAVAALILVRMKKK